MNPLLSIWLFRCFTRFEPNEAENALAQTVLNGLHGNSPSEEVPELYAQGLKHRVHLPCESLGHLQTVSFLVTLNTFLSPSLAPGPRARKSC